MSRRPLKRRVFTRDEWRSGSGITISPWRELIDDPKRGIRDLTDFNRKYCAFGGCYASRNPRPMRRERSERTFWYARNPNSQQVSPFPNMTDQEGIEFDDFFKTQSAFYRRLVLRKIEGEQLRDDMKDEALEAIYDGIRAAYFSFDPAHPPVYRSGKDGKAKCATRETFFGSVAKNALSDFISILDAEKRGYRHEHLALSGKPSDEIKKGSGEISVEVIEDSRRNTMRDMIFHMDLDLLRNGLEPEVRRAFDLMMDGYAHHLIRQRLGVSNDKYRKRYLAPIQNLALDLGFTPRNFNVFVDHGHVYRHLLNAARRTGKVANGR